MHMDDEPLYMILNGLHQTHIDLIGNHHKDSREYDTSAITRSSLFVDSN